MRRVIMRAGLLGVCLWVVAASGFAADLSDLVGGGVVKVVGDCKFTEGPAWHPDGYLLFSDIPNVRILRVNSDGSHSEWMKPSGGANGLMCDRAGNVYAAQGDERRVVRLRANAAGQGEIAAVLARDYDSLPFNKPNDLALDSHGGLYFTDPNYRPEPQSQPVQGVYYVAASGQVTRIATAEVPRPNGILVSQDGQTLYVANIEQRKIMAYPIVGPGTVSQPTVLFTGDESLDGTGPDGMALDEQGNLYATYKQVVVVSPAGGLIGRIDVPEKPANCAFGGAENRTLYITARTSLYSVPMKVRGMALQAAGPQGTSAVSGLGRPFVPPNFGRGAAVYFDAPAGGETVRVELQAEKGTVTLDVPKTWENQRPSNNLRLGQFVIPAAAGDSEGGELVVSGPFGGTVRANVDRWLQQFEGEGRHMRATQGESPQGKYVLVELTGTYKKPVGPPFAQMTESRPGYKMLGVILTKPEEGNFFLKLAGPQATVAAAAEGLRKSFGGDATKETEYVLAE